MLTEIDIQSNGRKFEKATELANAIGTCTAADNMMRKKKTQVDKQTRGQENKRKRKRKGETK